MPCRLSRDPQHQQRPANSVTSRASYQQRSTKTAVRVVPPFALHPPAVTGNSATRNTVHPYGTSATTSSTSRVATGLAGNVPSTVS